MTKINWFFSFQDYPTLPQLDGGHISKIGEEIICEISNFKFIQRFVKVMNIFIEHCATSPVYVDFDVTPVILYVCEW